MNKTCVVTGASSGIGLETARLLAAQGASLIVVCRDADRARAQLETIDPSRLRLVIGDLSLQSEVRRVAREVRAAAPRIDVLINNAGVAPSTRRLTPEGIELGMAVNVLAPFLLTELLRELLISSAPARIVNIAGAYHKKATFELTDLSPQGLSHQGPFDGINEGNRQKLLLVMLTLRMAKLLSGTGVTCNCLHPGIARTGIQRELPWPYHLLMRTLLRPLFRHPAHAAKNVVWLATAPELALTTGQYFNEKRPDAPSPLAVDTRLVNGVWAWCERSTQRR